MTKYGHGVLIIVPHSLYRPPRETGIYRLLFSPMMPLLPNDGAAGLLPWLSLPISPLGALNVGLAEGRVIYGSDTLLGRAVGVDAEADGSDELLGEMEDAEDVVPGDALIVAVLVM